MSLEWPTDAESWARIATFIPILLCSVVGFAVTLAKWLQLRRTLRGGRTLAPRVGELLGATEPAKALLALRDDPSPAARLLERAVTAAASPSSLASDIEQAGSTLSREINMRLGVVALIATLGPLFGLLGTVVGIAIVFDRLAQSGGIVNPGQLAGGIGTALSTTIAGLVVGILALVSHRWLAAQADEAVAQLETLGRTIVALRQEAP